MRTTLSLNGLWKFFPTLEDLGGNQRWMDGNVDPDAAAKEPEVKLDRGWINVGFDDSGWMDIPVPSSWNAAFEHLFAYEGVGWYRRTIMIPSAWKGQRVEFVSEGANYRVALYVNGKFAGEHEGGYNPFAIPIHPFLKYGAVNTIAVACDNIPKPERCPGRQFGWWNNGGLWRDVYLRATDTVYLDDVTVATTLDGARATVTVRVVVKNENADKAGRALAVDLFDPAGRSASSSLGPQVVIAANGEAEIEVQLAVENPLHWSPDEPNLYTLSVSLSDRASGRVGDTWAHRIGLRTIAVEGTKLLLNGKPLLVKGVNRHEQYEGGTLHTATHSEAQIARDVDLTKWVGANAVRQHYPNHRRLYELCDERGILALVEVPLWQWGRPLVETDHPDALASAKRQLEEIIKAYKNHACVFMWSVSNENLVKPKPNALDDPSAVALARRTADGNKELVAFAKSLDPTRPVVEVSNEWPDDPVHEVTDVSAVNVYVGAPNPPLASNIKQVYPIIHAKLDGLRKQVPNKPILVAEFGKWTIAGLLTPYPPGELYQAAKIKSEWEEFLKEPGFVGGFIWVFSDADVHRRFLWAPEFRVAYGLFDMKRRPKAAAFAVREMWTR